MSRFVCPRCGNTFGGEFYNCPDCGAARDERAVPEDVLEQASFIEKNADRYLSIFRKNDDKAVFLHTNWSAFFAAEYWFCYRKMFKNAALLTALRCLLLTVIVASMLFAFRVRISELTAIIGDEPVTAFSSDEVYLADRALAAIYRSITFTCIFAAAVINFAVSLFADCLYKSHIERKLGHSVGGTSVGAVFACLGIHTAVNDVHWATVYIILGLFFKLIL